MTGVSFTLDGMDTTTVWWLCTECGVEAELPAGDLAGAQVPCPDCPATMTEHWLWSSAA
jgi:uncharacterized paraquat-inducible protein A